jgi:hypothetical protein
MDPYKVGEWEKGRCSLKLFFEEYLALQNVPFRFAVLSLISKLIKLEKLTTHPNKKTVKRHLKRAKRTASRRLG